MRRRSSPSSAMVGQLEGWNEIVHRADMSPVAMQGCLLDRDCPGASINGGSSNISSSSGDTTMQVWR